MMRRFLDRLRTIHPEFQHWESMGATRFETIAADLSDLDLHLTSMAKPDKNSRASCSDLDAKFNVTPSTTSPAGFMFNLYTTDAGGGPANGQDHARPDIVSFQISVGGGSVSLSLAFPPARPDLIDPTVMRQVVDAVLNVWQPLKLEVISPELREQYLAGAVSRSQVEAGWFTYLRHPLLAACLPHTLPCAVEPIHDGGILFMLTPHVPDPDHSGDVKKARALQQFFDQLHFDHKFVIEGWPQDEAEDDYAHQVTGAPRNRKYVVAFCAFDGYDAQRKVLLYAKLFRGFTDEILHPYYLEDAERMEGLPFLVQARHQIAAVEYAGANTPIEWHIGIEENARDLATLFHDLAGISRERLRVVYTPFGA